MAFDLKGCTFKRRALNENQLSTTLTGKIATLRDWEFMDIAMEVDITAKDKQLVAERIESDCRFLSENDLLDYSLLLGINRATDINMPIPSNNFPDDGCTFPAQDMRKVFFMGLVDILEQ